MKKIILFNIVLFFTFSTIEAQCDATATSFGNNTSIPMYNVTGMVSVVLNTNNTVSLNLGSNFATAAGPDVRAFLVDRGTLTAAQLKIPANFNTRPKIEMGMITANGMASFTKTIPNGTNISNYNTIYFYCQQFNLFWDFGSFMPFTTANCAVLSNENFTSNQFKIYPNPSKGSISIDFDSSIGIKSFQLFSALGQKVFVSNEAVTSNTSIDISALNSGIYYMYLLDNNDNTIIKSSTSYE